MPLSFANAIKSWNWKNTSKWCSPLWSTLFEVKLWRRQLLSNQGLEHQHWTVESLRQNIIFSALRLPTTFFLAEKLNPIFFASVDFFTFSLLGKATLLQHFSLDICRPWNCSHSLGFVYRSDRVMYQDISIKQRSLILAAELIRYLARERAWIHFRDFFSQK